MGAAGRLGAAEGFKTRVPLVGRSELDCGGSDFPIDWTLAVAAVGARERWDRTGQVVENACHTLVT